jgi:hypothetical protein
MEKSKMIWIATKYFSKGYSEDQMRYGDDCYHLEGEEGEKKEQIKDQIVDYMDEIKSIGTIAFYEKYKEYKLF